MFLSIIAFLVALAVVFYVLGMIAGAKERAAAAALADGGTAPVDDAA